MWEENPEARYQYELSEDGTRFKNLIVQTPQMHRLYEKYHDVMFMDATYKTNKFNMALTVFSSVNNEGKNIILGFALVDHETSETYEWLMKKLREINDNIEPGVIHTDFDPAMWYGIERSFENSEHLLCQWHMMQNFKRHFLYLKGKRSAEAHQLHKMIIGLIFTESYKEFEEYLHLIFSSSLLDETKKQYLRKMLQIKTKWAAHAWPRVFNGGIHTISRAEAVNSQIKARIWSKSTLSDALDMMIELEEKVKQNILGKEKLLNEREYVINSPLLREMYDTYSNYAFEKMLYEFQLSHSLYVKKISEETSHNKIIKYVVKNKELRDNSVVTIIDNGQDGRTYICNWRFNVSHQIYWSHIFATFTVQQVRSLQGITPNQRWTKKKEWQHYKHINRLMSSNKPQDESSQVHAHNNSSEDEENSDETD